MTCNRHHGMLSFKISSVLWTTGLSLWRADRTYRLLGWIHVANIGAARVSGPSASRTTLPLRVVMASIHTSYDDPSGPPPGSPPTCTSLLISAFLSVLFMFSLVKYEGPWLSTQIMISLSIGMASFLIFSYSRTRWPLVFAPRTKLKGACRRFPLCRLS
jgi:hypothetical protein